MRWWTKCVSMVIAKTASRNIAFKAGTMSKAILDAQSSFVTPEATGQVRRLRQTFSFSRQETMTLSATPIYYIHLQP